jgi:hypothetical protein
MRRRFSSITLFLIVFAILDFSGMMVYALTYPVADSSQVVVRQPDLQFINVYRSQNEFNYTLPPIETNFLQRLWNYLKEQFGSWEEFTSAIPIIFKFLFGGFFIFLLFLAVTTTKLYKLFYSDPEIEAPEVGFFNMDSHPLDFDEAVRLQLAQKQYRAAIRLLYLKVINALRLKGYIHFSKEKTNVDYMLDLTNDDLKLGFNSITSIYNHVWYGELEIAENQFLRFEASFQSFYTAITIEK